MQDPTSDRKPLSGGEVVNLVMLLVIILGLFAAEVFTNYQPAKLGALLIVLFWIPLLVIHESGHALMASLLGWRVIQVVIGMGRPLWMFRVGGAVVEVRAVPVEGFVRPVPVNLHWPRLKSALIYFAGPGTELLVLGVMALLLGPDTLLSRSEDLGIIAAQSLSLAIAVSVVVNLVPHTAATPGGPEVVSDGLGILRSFFLPESYFVQLMGQPYEERPASRTEDPDEPDDWWK
jgi:hypothetical protein